jgi:D-3-phosphoglycerate dehydrogenase / 2-oxoglutarate reductase
MASATVLWTDPRKDRGDVLETLRDAGCEVLLGNDHDDRAAAVTEDELVAAAPSLHGIMLGWREWITRRVLEAAPNLVVVSKTGLGFDRIDVEAATELGVLVTNAPVDGHQDAVAEFAVALLLAWSKQLVRGEAIMRAGRFDRLRLTLLAGKTAGVIGYGNIGRRVGRILSGLGMRVISYDPYASPDATSVELDELLARSDVVTLHAAASASNTHLLDAAAFARMKRSAVVVNAARGSLIDEHALADAIRAGQVAGAAVNVYEQEPPPPDSPMLAEDIADRVLLTPHGAGQGVPEIRAAMPTVMTRLHLSALRGQQPEIGVVNPEVMPRWRGHRQAPLATG